jgi:hypothetical protein
MEIFFCSLFGTLMKFKLIIMLFICDYFESLFEFGLSGVSKSGISWNFTE